MAGIGKPWHSTGIRASNGRAVATLGRGKGQVTETQKRTQWLEQATLRGTVTVFGRTYQTDVTSMEEPENEHPDLLSSLPPSPAGALAS